MLVLSILKCLKLVFANNKNKISSFRLFLLYFGTLYRKMLQVKHKYTIKILKKKNFIKKLPF